ncbi:MAG: S8 family peptidase [Dehalococcoidia bacterium]
MDAAPEEVIVFEVAGSVDEFVRAVRRMPGWEWLVESDEFRVDEDADFRGSDGSTEPGIPARVYLVLADQEAIAELRRLWELYLRIKGGADEGWPRGQTPWRDLFDQLRDIRLWGYRDRVLDTGLAEDRADRLQVGDETVPAEIELWFRGTAESRLHAEESIRGLVAASGGSVQATALIPEIGYHAMLVNIPAGVAAGLVQGREVEVVRAGSIMFIRPAAQFTAPVNPVDELRTTAQSESPSETLGLPRLALLDGLPLTNHALLAGRLLLNDADDMASVYEAAEQRHGTAMASILVHGDLSSPRTTLGNLVYVRPVMRPDSRHIERAERLPDDVLSVDLIHRAVREMFEVTGGSVIPAAPTVRIVNFSIGDSWRPFDSIISPMARLLDWLSWKYNVLFVVSAGNHDAQVPLFMSRSTFDELEADAKTHLILRALWSDARLRRLLSPAESVNGLTVAAVNGDGSGAMHPRALAVYTSEILPSPINALGLGYGRSVKPDVLARGGRISYRFGLPMGTDGNEVLQSLPSGRAPGVQVAAVGPPGDLAATTFVHGTSNAAATISHLAARVYELLEETTQIPDEFRTVLTKCLVVHAACWGDAATVIERALSDVPPVRRRRELTRLLGFGAIEEERALGGTDQRVTLVGWGKLARDEAELYEVPLPPSLAGVRLRRRLTLTLAWLSPTTLNHRSYRQAALWFEAADGSEHQIDVKRSEVEMNMARRGTVQHEVFEGERASAFVEGGVLRFRVNRRDTADAGDDTGVPYGMAISLEVAADIQLPLFAEIFSRLRPAIRVDG